MHARIGWLSSVTWTLSLVACNELLDNRAGVLRDVETKAVAPPQAGEAARGIAAPDGGSSALDAGASDTEAGDDSTRAASSCPPGHEATSKSCGARCVPLNDPDYGCALAGCAPCLVPGATATCVNGTCAMLACDPGRADCDGDPADGCEADLTSTSTCGACFNACPPRPRAIATCVGTCAYDCEPGWTDCNGDPVDGCETNLADDPASCGRCGRRCLFGGCAGGQCILL